MKNFKMTTEDREQCQQMLRVSEDAIARKDFSCAARVLVNLLSFVKQCTSIDDIILANSTQLLEGIIPRFLKSQGYSNQTPCYTSQYKDHLKSVAVNIENQLKELALKPLQIDKFLKDMEVIMSIINASLKALFLKIVQDCLALVGPAPCGYEVLLIGEYACMEATPYSPVDYCLLIEKDNESCRQYFQNLAQLIELSMILLEATPPTSFECMEYGIKSITKPGFRIETETKRDHFDRGNALSLLQQGPSIETKDNQHWILNTFIQFDECPKICYGGIWIHSYEDIIAEHRRMIRKGYAVPFRKIYPLQGNRLFSCKPRSSVLEPNALLLKDIYLPIQKLFELGRIDEGFHPGTQWEKLQSFCLNLPYLSGQSFKFSYARAQYYRLCGYSQFGWQNDGIRIEEILETKSAPANQVRCLLSYQAMQQHVQDLEGFYKLYENPSYNKECTESHPEWLEFRQFMIHRESLKRGIWVIYEKRHLPEVLNNIQYGQRLFYFGIQTKEGLKKELPRSLTYDENLQSSRFNTEFKKLKTELQQLLTYSQRKNPPHALSSPSQNRHHLFNKERYQEQFLPVSFQTGAECYVYPWKNPASQTPFHGIQSFVTAGCLFGAGLRAYTNLNRKLVLIDHQLQLRDNEVIDCLEFNEHDVQPFEMVLFKEFEKNLQWVLSLHDPESPLGKPYLIYHLPSYDYILFGFNLWIQKKITRRCMDVLINIVLERVEFHEKRLQKICQDKGIICHIMSPYEQLFSGLRDIKRPTVINILQALGWYASDVEVPSPECSEAKLVKQVLHQLTQLPPSNPLTLVWQTWFQGHKNIDTMHALLHQGNIIPLMLASAGHADYESCSILPLSEKQIQCEYEKQYKQHSLNSKRSVIPALLNLTIFERVLTHTESDPGKLFQYSGDLRSLAELLRYGTDPGYKYS